jgi:hypothetical protein
MIRLKSLGLKIIYITIRLKELSENEIILRLVYNVTRYAEFTKVFLTFKVSFVFTVQAKVSLPITHKKITDLPLFRDKGSLGNGT